MLSGIRTNVASAAQHPPYGGPHAFREGLRQALNVVPLCKGPEVGCRRRRGLNPSRRWLVKAYNGFERNPPPSFCIASRRRPSAGSQSLPQGLRARPHTRLWGHRGIMNAITTYLRSATRRRCAPYSRQQQRVFRPRALEAYLPSTSVLRLEHRVAFIDQLDVPTSADSPSDIIVRQTTFTGVRFFALS